MARASYDITFDAFFSPLSTLGVPGSVYVAGQPGKLVPQTHIVRFGNPALSFSAWLTCDVLPPAVPVVTAVGGSGTRQVKTRDTLQVAVPSGGAQAWYVTGVQIVTPWSGPVYYRWLLHTLPYPPP